MHRPTRTIARSTWHPARWMYLLLAVCSLALAVLGVFLPLLPTVPFVLLAAWAAARSSTRLEQALLDHPRFGPPIRDWQAGGVVRRPAKWAATAAMTASAVLAVVTVPNPWASAAAVACMGAVLAWLWRRPEHAGSPP